MDKRIMFIDYDQTEKEYIITLHDGYHYAGKHIFTAIDKEDIREKMFTVKQCLCTQCIHIYPEIKKILSKE